MTAGTPISGSGREREVFLAAMEKNSRQERSAFLARECQDDPTLKERVEELLRQQEDVGDFLETPAVAAEHTAVVRGDMVSPHPTLQGTEKPGDRIGRYKLLQKIGEGGSGIVYMAEQEEPVRRRVALKILKLGMDTKSVIARFEAERQALAMMEHPNIAKVLDAGATETGRPYFVMELVRGIKITDYCDQNNLTTNSRLALFIQVCQAIQHAHQKGIIHRDIKPSNILVTLHDGTPVPKVIDFGIAKAIESRLTDKTLFTEFTMFIGTPAYMSPEQAEMSGLDIDTRSDIYSLGVLLYELLIGKTPFDSETLLSAGLDECRRTIREQEPPKPSTRLATMIESELTTTAHRRHSEPPKLIHLIRGDLDWIVMKSIEKDRTRRYATANDLAVDVHRYLSGEPVLARPPSSVYRFQKFARRHQGAFAAATAIVFCLVAGAGISAWLAIRATQAEKRALTAGKLETHLRQQAELERTRAEQKEAAAHLNEYVADINLAQQALAAGLLDRSIQLLNKHRPQPRETDLRGFEWRHLWQSCQGDDHISLPSQPGPVQSLASSPNGLLLAVGGNDFLAVYDTRSQALLTKIAKGVVSMAFFPDGKRLVTASTRTTRVWNTADWSEAHVLPENSGPIALNLDSTRLATCTREGIRIWDTATWAELQLLSNAVPPLAFSPDGETLATATAAGITLWPVAKPGEPLVLQNSTNLFPGWLRIGPWFRSDRALAFSPDGKSVLATRNVLSQQGVFIVSIWDAQTGQEIGSIPNDPEQVEHNGPISTLGFAPDGRTLATAGYDHSIRLWDFPTRRRLSRLLGHSKEVWAVTFTADGKNIISSDRDGSIKLWSSRPQPKEDMLTGGWFPLGFSPDSHTLAVLSRLESVVFLDMTTREPVEQFALKNPRFGFAPFVALTPDFSTLATLGSNNNIQVLNTSTHEATVLKMPDRRTEVMALSPDGRLLITGGRDPVLRWWSVRHRTNTVFDVDAQALLFSPSGKELAIFRRNNSVVEIWDVAARAARTNLVLAAQSDSQSAATSPSEPPAAPRSKGPFKPPPGKGAFQRTNAPSPGSPAVQPPKGYGGPHNPSFPPPGNFMPPGFSVFPPAAFSPDGRLLATAGSNGEISLWHVAEATLFGVCDGHKQRIVSVVFAPDGKTLATSGEDGTVKLWNVATQFELLTLRRPGGSMRGLTFSPDGRVLVGASGFMSQSPLGGLRFFHAPLFRETDMAARQK